jgi:F-type H+-transporting ATPase subunit delta
MKGTRAASRYAKSLLDLATEKGQLEECKADMALIASTIEENREFSILLNSPIINTEKKLAIINEIFVGKIGEITFAFLRIITSKRREGILAAIASSFLSLYNKQKNIFVASIVSATALDEGTRKELVTKIEEVTGGSVEITEKIDPELIGGFVLNVDNKQFNGSIAYQIGQLRRAFSKNAYQPKF